MLISIILSVALTAGAQAQSAQAGDARSQAEQLARSGAHRAALERFQALAAANPDDVEARVWIARLHALTGSNDRAIAVYQAIIATHPQHLDALLGLGHTLITVGRLREAADVLNRVESLAPESAQVLAAQGRLHGKAGRSTLALAYYTRALALEPSSATVRQEYNDLRAQRAHRVELGYVFEHFNTDVPDPQGGAGGVNARVTDAFRVSGAVQHLRKFSRSETRGGGGVEWMIRHALRVHAGALFGGDAQILPQTDGYGGIAYTQGRATWSFDVRVADFETITANVTGGGLRFALPQDSAVWVNYYRADTDYRVERSDIVHSWALGGSGRVVPGWVLGAEYTRGPDQLYLLTIDKLGPFEANTVSVFTDFRIAPMSSLDARYDYQTRPADVTVHRATLRLVQRF